MVGVSDPRCQRRVPWPMFLQIYICQSVLACLFLPRRALLQDALPCVCVCGKSMQWSRIMQLSQGNRVMQCNEVFNNYMYMYMHFCTLHSVKSNSKLTYLGLLLGASLLQQQKRQCVWSCTEHSSVHITLSKSSLMCFLAHSNRFTLLGFRISWQYVVPRNVQPRDVWQRVSAIAQ